MTAEIFTCNIYPVLVFFVIVLAIIGLVNTTRAFLHLWARYKHDELDYKKDIFTKEQDVEIVNKLLERFPLVDTQFMLKSERVQNIENNQEIHEINKKFAELSQKVEDLINGN